MPSPASAVSDPAPDHILVGLWAHRPTAHFMLGQVRMAHQILANGQFRFPLKQAVMASALLRPADLEPVMAAGLAALARAGITDPDAPGPVADITPPPPDWQWRLTLTDVLTIVTAADFLAKAHLGPFGDEMRYLLVEVQGRVSAVDYDRRQHELLTYVSQFLDEWRELFGHYPAYQARLAELARLNAYVQ